MPIQRALAAICLVQIFTTVHKLGYKKYFQSIAIFAAWMLIWQLISMVVGSELLLPGPFVVAKTLYNLMLTEVFIESVFGTLLRVLIGFALGMITGCLIGIVTSKSELLSAFLSPLRSLIKATPVTSFIVLVLLYMSSSVTPMFIAFLMVVPIAWTNMQDGLESTPKGLVEMAKVFGFSRSKTLWSIYLPSAWQNLISAATTSLGFAWKSCVAAEVIASCKHSIGRAIYESKIYLEVSELFAWTAAIIIMSIILERLMLFALRKLSKRRG